MSLTFKCQQLREWIQWPNGQTPSDEALCQRLTQLGLECEQEPIFPQPLDLVVTGRVTHCERHPNADRLSYCQVDVGEPEPLTIVCGCPSVHKGQTVVVAKVGARLPGDFTIKSTKIRGLASHGMLCSAQELGLATDAPGILSLPSNTPIGISWTAHANLDGNQWVIDVTPNRGDCLSLRGIAREIAAAYQAPLQDWKPDLTPDYALTSGDLAQVKTELCTRYHLASLFIEEAINTAEMPLFIRETLRLAHIKSIHPVVDILNYVMLEQGQPMHAFDAQRLQGPLTVNQAEAGEEATLLNGQHYVLTADDIVIRDERCVAALAGIMGSLDTAVSDHTNHFILESACFHPSTIARSCRQHDLSSDSSFRFERGVDPLLAERALQRVESLIKKIAPNCRFVWHTNHQKSTPPTVITLPTNLASEVLGLTVTPAFVQTCLERLGFTLQQGDDHTWQVTVPSHRYDCERAEDLIEEIGRSLGYDEIPCVAMTATEPATPELWQPHRIHRQLRQSLTHLGYQEIITYSFCDPAWLESLGMEYHLTLRNPLSHKQSVMRTNLLAGLLECAQYNGKRQRRDFRSFELGRVFEGQTPNQQPYHLAGLWIGNQGPKRWNQPPRGVDYYDIQGDITTLINRLWPDQALTFAACTEAQQFHPGQCAHIFLNDQKIGIVGSLHPRIIEQLSLPEHAVAFEIELFDSMVNNREKPQTKRHEFFPAIRRDMCYVCPNDVHYSAIHRMIEAQRCTWLQHYDVFDVHQSLSHAEQTDLPIKTVAISFTFRHNDRTLTDQEVDAALRTLHESLEHEYQIEVKT